MPDDVLRLRATVVSGEALEQIRAIGKEIGLTPQRAGKGVEQVNTGFEKLGKTVKDVGKQFTAIMPGLSGFGLGAASAGVAAVTLVSTLNNMAKKIEELKYASKELGISTQAIKGFAEAGEKVGISTEEMSSALGTFKRHTEDIALRMGSLRGEMVSLGAGPVLAAIQATADQGEKLKVALDFKEVLDRSDATGVKSRRFMEMMFGNAKLARLTREEIERSIKNQTIISPEDEKKAQQFKDSLIELGRSWDGLLLKGGIALFPGMKRALDTAEKLIEAFIKLDAMMPDWMKGKGNDGGHLPPSVWGDEPIDPRKSFTPFGLDPFGNWPQQGPQVPPDWKPPPEAGTKPLYFSGQGQGGLWGGDEAWPPLSTNIEDRRGVSMRGLAGTPAQPALDEFQRVIKAGTFDALVEFSTYGGGGFGDGGGGGSAPGYGIGHGRLGGRPGLGGGPGGRPAAPGAFPGGAPGVGPGGPVGPGAVGPSSPGSTGPASAGGRGGITAPAGTAIARQGLATVTTPSGKQFKVDARYAENFKGFLADYEKAGGVLGPDTGTLGSRPANASGHPIGTAIDINQIGYGIRSRRGVSLPPEVEDELAKKWGLVSGHQWRRPDTGHFGIQSPEAARKALEAQGIKPGQMPSGATVPQGGGTKATWFDTGGKIPGWSDPSGQREGGQASGLPSTTPGIATPGRTGLGEWFQVTLPDGRVVVTQKTDVGPGKGPQSKGIGLDVNAALASQLYPGGPSTFPSGRGGFHVKPLGPRLPSGMTPGLQTGAAKSAPAGVQAPPAGQGGMSVAQLHRNPDVEVSDAGPKVHPNDDLQFHDTSKDEDAKLIDTAISPTRINGHVNVTVNSNGTKATTAVKRHGKLFQRSTIKQHRQMQPTSSPDTGAGSSDDLGAGAD